MQVDIEAVGSLHLQRGLNTGRRESSLRGVGRDGTFHQTADFRKFGLRIVIFLRIIITRNPERRVVAGHRELSMFFLDDEIIQVLLQGELVTETQTIVEQAEADDDVPILCLLVECNSQFVVVVADLLHFAPHRLPCFIKGRSLGVCQCETVHQPRVVLQFQSQFGGVDDRLSLVRKFIDRFALCIYRKVQL